LACCLSTLEAFICYVCGQVFGHHRRYAARCVAIIDAEDPTTALRKLWLHCCPCRVRVSTIILYCFSCGIHIMSLHTVVFVSFRGPSGLRACYCAELAHLLLAILVLPSVDLLFCKFPCPPLFRFSRISLVVPLLSLSMTYEGLHRLVSSCSLPRRSIRQCFMVQAMFHMQTSRHGGVFLKHPVGIRHHCFLDTYHPCPPWHGAR